MIIDPWLQDQKAKALKKKQRDERKGKRPVIGKLFKKKPKTTTSFYMSDAWYKVRYQALSKYGAKCMCCGLTPPRVKIISSHARNTRIWNFIWIIFKSYASIAIWASPTFMNTIGDRNDGWREFP